MKNPHLELLFYRAPSPLDWSSPRRLLISTLRNRLHWIDGKVYPHSISHVNVVLATSSGKKISRGMSLSVSSVGYLYRFLFKGSSLDTMIINLPGKFMDDAVIEAPLKRYREKGYVETFRLLLNEAQAQRVHQYLELYQQYGLSQIYGALASDPLKGHGAGCSAFAVSVLEVLGLVTEEFKTSWSRELRVPLELMASETKGAKIGFLGFLLGRNIGWSSEKSPHYRLSFWDPERMFQWCRQFKGAQNHPEIFYDSKSQILFWDASGKSTPELDLKAHFESIAPQIQAALADRGKLWSESQLQTLLANQG